MLLPGVYAQNSKSFIVRSSFNNKSYELDISLPKHYSATDTVHYPVLYVLDGKYSFLSFYSIRAVYELGMEIKDVIIVAIDGEGLNDTTWMANRYNDFTPSHIPASDTFWGKFFKVPIEQMISGGALSFLNTIEHNIIPFVDAHYKTNSDRALFGHSLGGLFAGYCLLTKPGLFREYSINSPSFWWNNGEMLSRINDYSKKEQNVSHNIFISVGALEGNLMIAPVTNFTDSLRKVCGNSKITSQVFDDETHLSVVTLASSRTLKAFYGFQSK